MAIEEVIPVKYTIDVHFVDIMRDRQKGPDIVFLRTNIPNPCFPHVGTMSLRLEVTRYQGMAWVMKNFPGIDCAVTEFGVRPDAVTLSKNVKTK